MVLNIANILSPSVIEICAAQAQAYNIFDLWLGLYDWTDCAYFKNMDLSLN